MKVATILLGVLGVAMTTAGGVMRHHATQLGYRVVAEQVYGQDALTEQMQATQYSTIGLVLIVLGVGAVVAFLVLGVILVRRIPTPASAR